MTSSGEREAVVLHDGFQLIQRPAKRYAER